MNTKPSFAGVSKLLNGLTEQELAMLVANPKELKKLASSLVAKDIESTYFVPIADKDVPEKFKEMTVNWRKLASDLGYTGPVCWKVREGFTLKEHAPLAGPCYEAFKYLQNWSLKNDEATKSAHVFFIPKLLEKSTSKAVEEQKVLMTDTCKKYGLPEHHLASFGSAAMLTGLVLAHFKRTGEKTPVNCYWTRTDTLRGDGNRLGVGGFGEGGLRCVGWDWDDRRYGDLGVFPLGVELG